MHHCWRPTALIVPPEGGISTTFHHFHQGGTAMSAATLNKTLNEVLERPEPQPGALRWLCRVLLLSSLLLTPSLAVFAQTPLGTAFTYQGQLQSSGSPANGSFNLVFKLWNDPSLSAPANQIGPTLTFDGAGGNPPPVSVTNGLFTVQLDF